MTVAADLALVQSRLHDDETVWTRAELLRLYNDAYRQFLAQSGAVRRWRPTDLPGRHTFGITQEWEDGSASSGTVRKPTRTALAGAYQGMGLWEIEAVEGITNTTALEGHTQEWERAYRSGDSDLHFRFSFPRNHERVVRLEWQNRKLHPVGVRDLDDTDSRWFSQIGEPRWWTTGAGRVRSVELYEIASTYYQTYALLGFEAGIAREFSGARTWAVEVPIPNSTAYAYTSSADVPTLLSGLGSRVTRKVSIGTDYDAEVLRDRPAAYWRLGESSGTSATDASGNGNTGTYSGPTLGAASLLDSDTNTAATFDGTDDTMTSTLTLGWGGGGGSLEAWVRLNSLTPSSDFCIVGSSDAGFGDFSLRLRTAVSGPVLDLGLSGFTDGTTAIRDAPLPVPLCGPIYHLVVTWHPTSGFVAYVNGVAVDTAATTVVTYAATNVRLGRRAGGTPEHFRGTLDEVAVYNHRLPADRVLEHFRAGHDTTTTVYAIHVWEEEVLEGATTFTTSETIGCYSWEHQFGAAALTLAVGQARSVSSTARQYLPLPSDTNTATFLGRIGEWRSSEDSVFALEVVTPDGDLALTDTPTLLPAQLAKYLRYYVLSRAFGRPGEGRQPILAEFYDRRFKRGVALFRAFGDVARVDRVWQREEAVPAGTGRPAYVRLPSTFPSVWR